MEQNKETPSTDQAATKVDLSPRDIETVTEKLQTAVMNKELSLKIKHKKSKKSTKKPSSSNRRSIDQKKLNQSYAKTLEQVQSELPAKSRVFSKIVHNNVIEKFTDIISSTIARPNAMLSGSVFAFILTLLIYTNAKTIGYNLSGFETIAAFIVGWVIGIVYDYLRILFTGKKS